MPKKMRSPMQQALLMQRRNAQTLSNNLIPFYAPQQQQQQQQQQYAHPAPSPLPKSNASTNNVTPTPTPSPSSTRSFPRPKPQTQSDMRRYLLEQRRVQNAHNNSSLSSSTTTTITPKGSKFSSNTVLSPKVTAPQSSSSSSSSLPPPPPPSLSNVYRRPSSSPAATTYVPPSTTSYGAALRRHKALLIGIGYKTHRFLRPLPGCRTDVCNMHQLLTSSLFQYPEQNIHILCDELKTVGNIRVAQPTRINILRELNWLTNGLQPGDSAFFFFAGHGDFVVDLSGDEIETGVDQCIMSMDYEIPPPHGAGKLPKGAPAILDDIIYERLVRNVPDGAKVTALVDACRSGTVCDLPVQYDENGDVTFRNGSRGPPRMKHRQYMAAGGFVLFSGCSDSQLSADMVMRVRKNNDNGDSEEELINCGIMTTSFIDSVVEMCQHRNENDYRGLESWTYGMLMQRVRHLVTQRARLVLQGNEQLVQQPQLSSSHAINIWNTPFSI